MSDPETDSDLLATTQRVAELARRVDINPQHKARLRQELLRRHQELSAEHTQRAAGMLWPRLTRLKRLTLVAPTALAAAVAGSILVWALQISGHQSPQAAEAARLSRVLSYTVPSVTRWTVQVTLHQLRDNAASVQSCSVLLRPNERVYIANRRAYFYSYGKWYQVTTATAKCLPDWQWGFAELAVRLADRDNPPDFRPAGTVNGQPAEQISYVVNKPNHVRVVMTALVEQRTGLVRRLQRLTIENGTVVEQASADYGYQRMP